MNLAVFVLGGIILIAAGVLQAFLRPRPAERGRGVSIDGSVVRALVFVVVGVLAVLVGLGVVPMAQLHL